ncbi:mucin-2-like [Pelmatolapia mariae]|uniref:mucin-2-like n=1 Tax=Pelmatolapia mariae TaxID=158779 RepID=UPI002FE58A14
MFSYFIFLVASSVTFLCTHQVSSKDPNCTEYPVFTPPALIVKYGDPANVTCVVCQKDCSGVFFGLEHAVGKDTKNGTTIFWTVDRLTEWDTSLQCYHTNNVGDQCTSILNPTLYEPPESVSISFVNHTGMMTENQQYTLQCSVQNVAPVQSLTVTFYRGNTALGHLQSNHSEEKKPVNETFTLNITPSREDDGAQYWCKTKLELGPAGPQPPPVVKSETLNSTVYFTTTTRKPEPTTIKSTTRSTTRATTPQTTKSTTTTTKSTTSSATTTTVTTTAVIAQRSTKPTSSSNKILTHSFMCLMLLLSALI